MHTQKKYDVYFQW